MRHYRRSFAGRAGWPSRLCVLLAFPLTHHDDHGSFRCWDQTAALPNLFGAKRSKAMQCSASSSERIKDCRITLECSYAPIRCVVLWTENYPTPNAASELRTHVIFKHCLMGYQTYQPLNLSVCRTVFSTIMSSDWYLPLFTPSLCSSVRLGGGLDVNSTFLRAPTFCDSSST